MDLNFRLFYTPPGPQRILGSLGEVAQIPAPGSRQGILWREDWNLFRLARYVVSIDRITLA